MEYILPTDYRQSCSTTITAIALWIMTIIENNDEERVYRILSILYLISFFVADVYQHF